MPYLDTLQTSKQAQTFHEKQQPLPLFLFFEPPRRFLSRHDNAVFSSVIFAIQAITKKTEPKPTVANQSPKITLLAIQFFHQRKIVSDPTGVFSNRPMK